MLLAIVVLEGSLGALPQPLRKLPGRIWRLERGTQAEVISQVSRRFRKSQSLKVDADMIRIIMLEHVPQVAAANGDLQPPLENNTRGGGTD